MPSLSFDPARTAVLCMDYQNGIVANIKDQEVLPRAASASGSPAVK